MCLFLRSEYPLSDFDFGFVLALLTVEWNLTYHWISLLQAPR